MAKMFIPSSNALQAMISAAEAKFDAARREALDQRAERAIRINARVRRERHEAYLIQMPRARGFQT